MFAKLFAFVALLALIAQSTHVSAAATLMPSICSAQEESAQPCTCCRKSCWFGIAEMATGYFGHMPGERSDAEAKFTLAMMQTCFHTECADSCPTPSTR